MCSFTSVVGSGPSRGPENPRKWFLGTPEDDFSLTASHHTVLLGAGLAHRGSPQRAASPACRQVCPRWQKAGLSLTLDKTHISTGLRLLRPGFPAAVGTVRCHTLMASFQWRRRLRSFIIRSRSFAQMMALLGYRINRTF